jgi:hypothetical protein
MGRDGRRHVRLWLPLFLFLPLIYLLIALFTALAALLALIKGRYHEFARTPLLLAALVCAFHAARGLVIHVVDGNSIVSIKLS